MNYEYKGYTFTIYRDRLFGMFRWRVARMAAFHNGEPVTLRATYAWRKGALIRMFKRDVDREIRDCEIGRIALNSAPFLLS